jgi:Family of unknown function (DUF6152)
MTFVRGVLFSAMLLAVPLSAYHNLAEICDSSKVVTLKGTVSKMEWYNPHITLYVNVKNPDGTVVSWAVTFLPPHELTRQKITKETIAVGQEITIPVWLHKDHSTHAEAAPRSIVTLTGGTTIKMPDDLWHRIQLHHP